MNTTFQDPYSRILNVMREQGKAFNPPSIMLGEVVSTNPLTVKLAGIQIDKDNLLIADYLLENYSRTLNIENTTNVTAPTNTVSSHSHALTSFRSEGTAHYVDGLNSGDILAVLPMEDMQMYLVLCRVVKLE